MQDHFIETTTGVLRVGVVGQYPAVSFWPSLFPPHAVWDGVIAALPVDFTFIVIDPPGLVRSLIARSFPTSAAGTIIGCVEYREVVFRAGWSKVYSFSAIKPSVNL
jgi:hypothetical protein